MLQDTPKCSGCRPTGFFGTWGIKAFVMTASCENMRRPKEKNHLFILSYRNRYHKREQTQLCFCFLMIAKLKLKQFPFKKNLEDIVRKKLKFLK